MLWNKAIGAGGINKEGWNVSTAVFLQSVSVSLAVNPNGLFFKPDGLKMYVVGSGADSVYEYNLGTAWNVSTAVFLQSFSVAGQETNPDGLFFKPDGLKMYVVGNGNDRVYEYNLGTAWNVSTAVFLQSFLVSGQDTSPVGLFFRDDGLKMHVVGIGSNRVYEYNLGTAWNVSTAVFLQSFSVNGQDTQARDVFFKPDGLKMYVVGNGNDRVYEYNLSTAWNISTALFLQSFLISGQDGTPVSLFLRGNGQKMYITGFNNTRIYEYDLTS